MVEVAAATATQMQSPAPAHPMATLEGTLARWVAIQGLLRRPKQTDLSQVGMSIAANLYCQEKGSRRQALVPVNSISNKNNYQLQW